MLIPLSVSAEQLHPANPVTADDDIVNLLPIIVRNRV